MKMVDYFHAQKDSQRKRHLTACGPIVCSWVNLGTHFIGVVECDLNVLCGFLQALNAIIFVSILPPLGFRVLSYL